MKLALRASLERYKKAWRDRKASVMDIVGAISEASGKKVGALLEAMGVETDKEAGQDIADFAA
jgi:hypothetical protein